MKKSKLGILDHVDFLDLVRIHVYKDMPSPGDMFPFRIEFECLDQTKRIVFDEHEFKKMNQILTEKAQQFNPKDPRLPDYLQEFSGRLASELYRNGLCEFEDIPEGKEDPYAFARKIHPLR